MKVPMKPSQGDTNTNESFERRESLNIENIRPTSVLLVKDEHIFLDTIRKNKKLSTKVQFLNASEKVIRIQDVLVADPNIDVSPGQYTLRPYDSIQFDVKITPTGTSGFKTFELIFLNNTLETEKLVRISGYFE